VTHPQPYSSGNTYVVHSLRELRRTLELRLAIGDTAVYENLTVTRDPGSLLVREGARQVRIARSGHGDHKHRCACVMAHATGERPLTWETGTCATRGGRPTKRPSAAVLHELHHGQCMTLREIAARYEVDARVVTGWFEVVGVTVNPGIKSEAHREAIVRDYLHHGLGIRAIQARYRVSAATIRRFVREAGGEMRPGTRTKAATHAA
jgi:transposase